jgi:hypothetical protein
LPTRKETAHAAGCRELRLRVGYRDLVGVEYLIVSPDEMAEIADGTGWEISDIVRDEASYCVAVLD